MTTPVADLLLQHPWLQNFINLGFDTVEQILGAAAVAGPEVAAMIGDDMVAQLAAITPFSTLSAASIDTLAALPCPLGAVEPPPTAAVMALAPQLAIATPASASSASLVAQMPPVRDQGYRGTCVAHAVLATYELSLVKAGAYHDMSEQFLYWNCKANDGIPNTEGTYISVASKLLARDGCCTEAIWPYVSTVIPGNEGQGPVPQGAQRAALSFRPARTVALPPKSISDIKNMLFAGSAVAFSVPVFNSWWQSSAVRNDGMITNPVPGEIPNGGHAMCFVGFEDLPGRPELGGGRFILRNSWGNAWGRASPYGPGYGSIPYIYIQRFCMEAYALA